MGTGCASRVFRPPGTARPRWRRTERTSPTSRIRTTTASDRFTYVVADAGGLADTATVEVTVTPVNDAPEAADDQATTREDEAIEIPVLDNDADLDGDRLRVRSVSPAGHGAAEVAGGGTHVTYVPDPNYHGPDRFTYVVADMDGLADTATVEVTVVPVNDGPEAVGTIPDQLLDEGADGVTVDLTPFFTDLDGDPLDFTAETSNADVVTPVVSGAALVLLPVTYGDATVIVTATDPGGLAATQRVTVGVSDRSGRAVLSDAFAVMARSYLSSARMTLERRVAPGARARGVPMRASGRGCALEAGPWRSRRGTPSGTRRSRSWRDGCPTPRTSPPRAFRSPLHQIRAPDRHLRHGLHVCLGRPVRRLGTPRQSRGRCGVRRTCSATRAVPPNSGPGWPASPATTTETCASATWGSTHSFRVGSSASRWAAAGVPATGTPGRRAAG